MLKIGFDPAKDERNRRDRSLSFADAAQIFLGTTYETVDERFAYGETRLQAIGEVDGELLAVVYTWRSNDEGLPYRWIISARPASRKERRTYGHGDDHETPARE